MRISLIAVIYLLSFSANCIAQKTGRMDTDRPDQTESPSITRKGYLQAEIGFNNEKYNSERIWVHPTALWKLGISSGFEFRLITESSTIEKGMQSITGLSPIQLGGKIAICEENGLIPKTSLIFHTGIPALSTKNYRTPQLAPNFRFTMQHTITENIGIGYNLGGEWNGEGGSPEWIYTLAPGMNIGKRWYAYAEIFGSVRPNQTPLHGIDGGIAYYFTDDIKIDFSGGKGLNGESITNYVAIGLSFRFKMLKN